MFIHSLQSCDILNGIHVCRCHCFTTFKQSKSSVSWLNRKILHQDGKSSIAKQ